MIKILDDTKDLSQISLNDNGLGKLEIISGTDTEELNGIYEAEFSCLMTEKYFDLLHVEGLVALPTEKGEQIFRIYYISKPLNKVVTVKCRHITYDLTKTIVQPFEATGSAAAVAGILSNVMTATPFTITTDIANSTSVFQLTQPRAFRQILGGYQGSFLDVFRGEYEWDNLEVKMLARRGADRGVRIAYRKNLTGCKMELDSSAVYTSVMAFVNIDNNVVYGNVYHKITATYPKVLILDASNDFSIDNIPTAADLTTYAQTYATNNDIESPKLTASIEFVPLWQTDEYKEVAPLERVSLGDTVHADVSEMGMTATARVIKTVWNLNTQRYDSLILGSVKSSLASIIQSTVQTARDEAEKATSVVSGQMNEIASLIINGLGLHRTLVPTADGGYKVYLHNHATLADSDVQYYMSAGGIMVSTDYGQTWNAGFDAEGNAVLNSLATITLKALEIYGSRIVFGDIDNKYIIADEYQLNGEDVGISFDGSGYVRFRPQEHFEVRNNNTANTDFYNYLAMRKTGITPTANTGPDITMINKNDDLKRANDFYMCGNYDANDGNYASLSNYIGDTEKLANKVGLQSSVSNSNQTNNIAIVNYDPSANGNISNRLDILSGGAWNYVRMSNYKNNILASRLELSNTQANISIRDSSGNTSAQLGLTCDPDGTNASMVFYVNRVVSFDSGGDYDSRSILTHLFHWYGYEIVVEKNLNNYTKCGFYYARNNGEAGTMTNSPTKKAFTLRVYDATGEGSTTSPAYRIQEITTYEGEKWIRRGVYNGSYWSWRGWQEYGWTVIPSSSNLNAVTYTQCGTYVCQNNADAQTLTNSPTQLGFTMKVFDALGGAQSTGWAYRLQDITDYQGNSYRRYGETNGTTTWTWSTWNKYV